MNNFTYYDPSSVDEAVTLLQQHAGNVKVLAGGTDVFLRMRRRLLRPEAVVDLKRIAALRGVSYSAQDGLRLGATATHGEVLEHAAVAQHYGALARAAQWVGSPQTRHRGTVVGNICNASPAADTAPALLAYEAQVHITGPAGGRVVPMAEFFQGPGRTVLAPAEIVTALHLPPPQGRGGWGYGRRTRTVIDIALVSVCAVVQATDNLCSNVCLGLGAVGPTPLRATRAEGLLRGQRPTTALVAEAARTAANESRPISDVRCSAAYRQDMVEVLTRRCLETAMGMLQLL